MSEFFLQTDFCEDRAWSGRQMHSVGLTPSSPWKAGTTFLSIYLPWKQNCLLPAPRPIAQLSLHCRQPAELLDCTKAALAKETSGIWEGLGSAVQCKKTGWATDTWDYREMGRWVHTQHYSGFTPVSALRNHSWCASKDHMGCQGSNPGQVCKASSLPIGLALWSQMCGFAQGTVSMRRGGTMESAKSISISACLSYQAAFTCPCKKSYHAWWQSHQKSQSWLSVLLFSSDTSRSSQAMPDSPAEIGGDEASSGTPSLIASRPHTIPLVSFTQRSGCLISHAEWTKTSLPVQGPPLWSGGH